MATYIIVNDKGEYFTGFRQAPIGPRSVTPMFAPISDDGMTVQLVTDAGIEETEQDLKKFNIDYRLIEVNS